MKTFERYYHDTPPIAKIIIAGGVALLVYEVIHKANKAQGIADANKTGTAAAADIQAEESGGASRTLDDVTIQAMVEQLVQAMNGCGTDETMVYDVFRRLNNKLDALYLIKAFGVQFYQPCAASQPLSYMKWLWDDQSFGGDLGTWLAYDLSTDEIGNINKILVSKGIGIQF
jgi:hypothetical protein